MQHIYHLFWVASCLMHCFPVFQWGISCSRTGAEVRAGEWRGPWSSIGAPGWRRASYAPQNHSVYYSCHSLSFKCLSFRLFLRHILWYVPIISYNTVSLKLSYQTYCWSDRFPRRQFTYDPDRWPAQASGCPEERLAAPHTTLWLSQLGHVSGRSQTCAHPALMGGFRDDLGRENHPALLVDNSWSRLVLSISHIFLMWVGEIKPNQTISNPCLLFIWQLLGPS